MRTQHGKRLDAVVLSMEDYTTPMRTVLHAGHTLVVSAHGVPEVQAPLPPPATTGASTSLPLRKERDGYSGQTKIWSNPFDGAWGSTPATKER